MALALRILVWQVNLLLLGKLWVYHVPFSELVSQLLFIRHYGSLLHLEVHRTAGKLNRYVLYVLRQVA